MEYSLPTMEDEAALREYVQEHYDHGEHSISASMGMPVMPYADWVRQIHANAAEGNGDWGRSLLYVCREHGRIVGLLSVRYELSEALSLKYGDIGYGVRPSERRRGYAGQMLRHALDICREKGMKRVILGCYRDNVASASVIERGGGVLFAENDNYKEGRVSRYYAVEL